MSRHVRHCCVAATTLACSLSVAALAAQSAPPLVEWRPRLPLQGSVMVVGVRPAAGDSVTAVRGELAGEPLHFDRTTGSGEFRAVGAVPLDAGDSVIARLVVERGGVGDTLAVALPVRRRRAPHERLRAASEFVQPPDSVADRIRIEGELVQEVRQRAHDTPRLWSGPFVRPRRSKVTSVFGTARVFNRVVQSRHLGVDFAGQRGAPVRAANRGVVAFVADLYYSGSTVLIDHGEGLVTGYLHLSQVLVTPGDMVAAGQLIGRVGASGRVTGPHLHWLAAYGRLTVDPLSLVSLDVGESNASLPSNGRGRVTSPR